MANNCSHQASPMPTDPLFYLALVFIFFVTLKMSRGVVSLFFMPTKRRNSLHTFYSRHSHYYNKLDPKYQKRFLIRANSLSRSYRIIGRQGFKITEQVRLMVVAGLVQITFGFTYYRFPRFRTIFVYPDSYRNPHTGKVHDGEVNARGLIILSWKKLVKGFEDPSDKLNLGLHEMAHVLMHTILHTHEHEQGLDEYLEKFLKVSKVEIEKINAGEYHFFRPYAGVNIEEFFAVAIEHFFEAPEEFSAQLPTLYKKLTLLLKQDPARNIPVLNRNSEYQK